MTHKHSRSRWPWKTWPSKTTLGPILHGFWYRFQGKRTNGHHFYFLCSIFRVSLKKWRMLFLIEGSFQKLWLAEHQWSIKGLFWGENLCKGYHQLKSFLERAKSIRHFLGKASCYKKIQTAPLSDLSFFSHLVWRDAIFQKKMDIEKRAKNENK